MVKMRSEKTVRSHLRGAIMKTKEVLSGNEENAKLGSPCCPERFSKMLGQSF